MSFILGAAGGVIQEVVAPPPETADWFVSKTGNDANGGQASNDPFLTIGKAVSVVSAGEVIEVAAGRYDEKIEPTTSGTDGNEITLRSKPGDAVRVVASGEATEVGTLEFNGLSYWIVHGDPADRTLLKLGDADLTWIHADGGRSVTSDGNVHYINNTNHIDVRDATIYGGRSLGASHLNWMKLGSHTYRFLRINWLFGGDNNDPLQVPPAERGDLFFSQGHTCLVDDCTFKWGGHDNFIFHGENSVMRNCDVDGDWTDLATGQPGQRLGSFSTARDDRADAPWGPGMIEGCTLRRANASGDLNDQNGHKFTGDGIISRLNYYWDNRAEIISSSPVTGQILQPNSHQKNRIYHNTAFNNGGFLRVRDTNPETVLHKEYGIKNNISVSMTGASREQDGVHTYWDMTSIDPQGYPDNHIGAEITGNVFHATGTDYQFRLLNSATLYNVSEAQATFPLVWSGNIEAAPVFVDAAARTKAGFKLASGSAGVSDAQPLTTITSGSSGSVLTVGSPEYFYDGFNLAYFGEDQKTDFIKIVPAGQDPVTNGSIVRVAYQGRNDALKQLTITTTLTVINGDEIYLVLQDGTTVCTHSGADQNPVAVADWFVSKSGSDTNDGLTEGTAFLTISKAVTVVSAGEIIEVSTGRYDETISPAVNGTDGNEITLQAKPGAQVRISALLDGDTLDFDGVSYWIVKDIDDIGDGDLTWTQASAGKDVTARRNINFGETTSTHHIDIQNCYIWGGSGQAGAQDHCNRIYRVCHNIRFLDCTLDLAGTNNDLGLGIDYGDLMQSRGTSVIYENCTISHGGHDTLRLFGAKSVVRNCVLDGSWVGKGTGFDGSRCMALAAGDARGAAPWGPQLAENNIFKNANASVDSALQRCIQVEGDGLILRSNYFWDNHAEILSTAILNPGAAFSTQKHRIYNNTAFNNGNWLRVRDTDAQKDLYLDHHYFNNISVDMTGTSNEQTGVHVYFDASTINAQGQPDNWIGAVWAGNMFKDISAAVQIRLLNGTTLYDVAEAETNFALVWTIGNTEENPTFVDSSSRTKAGFALTGGSAGVGAAQPITHVTSGSSGAVVTLDDVLWIYDGFDLIYFGEDQKTDYIKIVPTGLDPAANGTVVRVTYQGRNDGLSQVTIDQSLVVTAGDDVYPVSQNGVTVWDNKGAAQ